MSILAMPGMFALLLTPWPLGIWSIVDCVASERSVGEKIRWTVGIILTWGIGNLLYGVFRTQNKVLRVVSAITAVLILLVFISPIKFVTSPFQNPIHSFYVHMKKSEQDRKANLAIQAAVDAQLRSITDRLNSEHASFSERENMAINLAAFSPPVAPLAAKPFVEEALAVIEKRKSHPMEGDEKIETILRGSHLLPPS